MRTDTRKRPGQAEKIGSRTPVVIGSIVAVLALVGLADATFLTVMHLTGEDQLCGASAGCSVVLSSPYSSAGPVPTAAFGILAYFAVFSLGVLAAFRYGVWKWLIGIVTVMFLFTLWLLYLQAFVLHAFCPYCLLSAALSFLLAGVLISTSPSR